MKAMRAHYRGWDIEILCTHRLVTEGDAPRPRKFTASAFASLAKQSENGDIWIDARTQSVGLGSRCFDNESDCVGAILADVKELIDALRK